MKNLIFRFVVLASFLGSCVVHANDISTGKMVFAALEAVGFKKTYVDESQVVVQGDKILFLNIGGEWQQTSFLGRDDGGLFICNLVHPRCPECKRPAPDGICINPDCKRYMQY